MVEQVSSVTKFLVSFATIHNDFISISHIDLYETTFP